MTSRVAATETYILVWADISTVVFYISHQWFSVSIKNGICIMARNLHDDFDTRPPLVLKETALVDWNERK